MDNNIKQSGLSVFFNKLRPKKGVSLNSKKARAGWLFMIPFIVGLLLFYLPVIYESLCFSVATYNPTMGVSDRSYTLTWVGFQYYADAFSTTVNTSTGETFVEMLFSSFGQQIVDIIAIILLSLFVAIMLNSKMVGRAAFRAIFFVPVIIGTGIIADINLTDPILENMSSLEGIDLGSVASGGFNDLVSAMDLTMIFSNLGLGTVGSKVVEVVTNLVGDIYNIVNRSGVQMLIFLAGLQSISPSVYESAQMEGASAWETFWKITIPMISPMILANSLYTVIDSFTAPTNRVMQYISPINGDFLGAPNTLTTAMGWIYFMLVVLSLLLISAICSRFVFYQRRND